MSPRSAASTARTLRPRAAARPTPAAAAPAVGTESRKAWSELLALLADADKRYLGKDWEIERAGRHRRRAPLPHARPALGHGAVARGRPAAPARGALRHADAEAARRQPGRDLLHRAARPEAPLPRARQHGRRGLHVAHDRGRQRRGPLPEARRGRAQRHAIRREARRLVRGAARPGREGPQPPRARARRGHAHHAPLLRDDRVRGGRSEPEGAPLRRSGRRSGAAAHAERREHRRGDPARGELLPRRHARSAAAGSGEVSRPGCRPCRTSSRRR